MWRQPGRLGTQGGSRQHVTGRCKAVKRQHLMLQRPHGLHVQSAPCCRPLEPPPSPARSLHLPGLCPWWPPAPLPAPPHALRAQKHVAAEVAARCFDSTRRQGSAAWILHGLHLPMSNLKCTATPVVPNPEPGYAGVPQWPSARLSLETQEFFEWGIEQTCMVSAALWADSWAVLSSLLGARLPLSRSIRSTWHAPPTPSSSGTSFGYT